ncbi:Precorrin-2 dehydrogenase [Candidatus Methanobinarius endosymbioticus]|uniref:precorrin-2 dehydrogenase n=1 Tax=Candidatus Methanobinarius endosymbioticus TaxID=2006182 RepID=A0A366MBS7_9EURY|nr:Precorrin-2 dehydrogenase [Candidatus Methanobinarius endosymbioticus]
MKWTSLFLDTSRKNVFILGTGEVATRRAEKFLESGSNVILSGKNISQNLLDKGAMLEKDNSETSYKKLVEWADIVIIASGDQDLNEYVSSISGEKLLNRADYPEKGDLIVPTSFYIEDIQISIFTNGKSPLMGRELRKKIQNTISREDILQIKFQDYSRTILKEKITDQKIRKEYLYKILENEDIRNLLKEEKLEEAKIYIKNMVKNAKENIKEENY